MNVSLQLLFGFEPGPAVLALVRTVVHVAEIYVPLQICILFECSATQLAAKLALFNMALLMVPQVAAGDKRPARRMYRVTARP